MAGHRGMGALGFQFLSADAAHAWVNSYYNNFVKRQEKLTDYVTNPNIALVCGFMCAETDEEAMRKADGWTFFQFALRFYVALGRPVEPGTVNLWEEYQSWKESVPGQAAEDHGAGWLARDAPAQAPEVRVLEHRPGDPAQPGRQELKRGHL